MKTATGKCQPALICIISAGVYYVVYSITSALCAPKLYIIHNSLLIIPAPRYNGLFRAELYF